MKTLILPEIEIVLVHINARYLKKFVHKKFARVAHIISVNRSFSGHKLIYKDTPLIIDVDFSNFVHVELCLYFPK